METETIIHEIKERYFVINNCYILGIIFNGDTPYLKIKTEWDEIREFPLDKIYYNINQINKEK